MEEQIIHTLLLAAVKTDSVDGLRKLLRQLTAWQKRESGNRVRLGQWVTHILQTNREEQLRDAMTLNLVSLGWHAEEIHTMTGFSVQLDTRNARIYQTCFNFSGTRSGCLL